MLCQQAQANFCPLQVQRHESCHIVLHGRAEFEASNVILEGNMSFEVPDGHRMVVSAGPHGRVRQSLELLTEEPSWQWKYAMDAKRNVKLQLQTASTAPASKQPQFDAAELSYMI